MELKCTEWRCFCSILHISYCLHAQTIENFDAARLNSIDCKLSVNQEIQTKVLIANKVKLVHDQDLGHDPVDPDSVIRTQDWLRVTPSLHIFNAAVGQTSSQDDVTTPGLAPSDSTFDIYIFAQQMRSVSLSLQQLFPHVFSVPWHWHSDLPVLSVTSRLTWTGSHCDRGNPDSCNKLTQLL